MVGPDVIPLPHIYGARIKGVEVFCPLDPPPPYEAVVNETEREQVLSVQVRSGMLTTSRQSRVGYRQPGEIVCSADLFKFMEPR